MADLFNEPRTVGGTVQKVTFEAVKVFDCEGDVGRLSVVGCLGESVFHSVPFVGGGARARKLSQSRVNGTTKMCGSDSGAHVDTFFQMVESRSANFGRFGHGVGFGATDGDRSASQIEFVES